PRRMGPDYRARSVRRDARQVVRSKRLGSAAGLLESGKLHAEGPGLHDVASSGLQPSHGDEPYGLIPFVQLRITIAGAGFSSTALVGIRKRRPSAVTSKR